MNAKQKRQLIDKIDKLFETDTEYHQLLNIFLKYNIKMTQNDNGFFIDLAKVNNKKVLNEIITVVDICEQSKNYLQESTKAYNEAIRKK